MAALRELLSTFEAEVDRITGEVERESRELVDSVDQDVEGFGMHLNVSVTTLVDAAHDEVVEGGLEPLDREMVAGVASLGAVERIVQTLEPAIEGLARSKRILEYIEEKTSEIN